MKFSGTKVRTFSDLAVGDLVLLLGCDIVWCSCEKAEWARKIDEHQAKELRTGFIHSVSTSHSGETLTYTEYLDLCSQNGREPAF